MDTEERRPAYDCGNCFRCGALTLKGVDPYEDLCLKCDHNRKTVPKDEDEEED